MLAAQHQTANKQSWCVAGEHLSTKESDISLEELVETITELTVD